MGRRWTKDEWRYLRVNYGRKDTASIARHLGRSRCSVSQKAMLCGLKKGNVWTDETASRFAELYSSGADMEEITSAFSMTRAAAYQRAHRLGIRRHGRDNGKER